MYYHSDFLFCELSIEVFCLFLIRELSFLIMYSRLKKLQIQVFCQIYVMHMYFLQLFPSLNDIFWWTEVFNLTKVQFVNISLYCGVYLSCCICRMEDPWDRVTVLVEIKGKWEVFTWIEGNEDISLKPCGKNVLQARGVMTWGQGVYIRTGKHCAGCGGLTWARIWLLLYFAEDRHFSRL